MKEKLSLIPHKIKNNIKLAVIKIKIALIIIALSKKASSKAIDLVFSIVDDLPVVLSDVLREIDNCSTDPVAKGFAKRAVKKVKLCP